MAEKPTYQELEKRIQELELAESERKHAEDELQKRETTIQTVFDTTPVGICIMKNRVYQRVNRNWCESFGYPEENLIGRTNGFLYESHEEYERVGKELSENLLKKGVASVRARLKRSDGEFRDVELIAKPFHPYDIEAGYVVVVHDITDRKRTKEALRESEKQMRTIIEHSNEMFYIHDTNHVLTYVSATSEAILGYTPKEMVRKWTELATDNPINLKGIEITENAIKTGKKHEPYLLELEKRDGTLVLLEIDESPVKDTTGKVIGISGAIRDVTQQKQTQDKLIKT